MSCFANFLHSDQKSDPGFYHSSLYGEWGTIIGIVMYRPADYPSFLLYILDNVSLDRTPPQSP